MKTRFIHSYSDDVEVFDFDKNDILRLISGKPSAYAIIKGGEKFPDIEGVVAFYQGFNEVIVALEVKNLPDSKEPCAINKFAIHIHEGGGCESGRSPFSYAGGHFNPQNCKHPAHAGDMPTLISNNGNAFMAFLTNRFSVKQIIGRTVIIHIAPDDMTTDPSGNSGERIACGVIVK